MNILHATTDLGGYRLADTCRSPGFQYTRKPSAFTPQVASSQQMPGDTSRRRGFFCSSAWGTGLNRTPRQVYRPIHSSKMALPTVKSGPPYPADLTPRTTGRRARPDWMLLPEGGRFDRPGAFSLW